MFKQTHVDRESSNDPWRTPRALRCEPTIRRISRRRAAQASCHVENVRALNEGLIRPGLTERDANKASATAQLAGRLARNQVRAAWWSLEFRK